MTTILIYSRIKTSTIVPHHQKIRGACTKNKSYSAFEIKDKSEMSFGRQNIHTMTETNGSISSLSGSIESGADMKIHVLNPLAMTTVPPPLPAGFITGSATPPLETSTAEAVASKSGAAGLVGKDERIRMETLEANRVKSALEHRKLVYRELNTFDQLLLYHRQWLEQPPIVRQSQVMPAETLDPRGDDLPMDQLHALATQSQVKSVAQKASAAIAIDGDRNLLHVDRYIYWCNTKAPPADWQDVLPELLALHDVNAGFLVVDMGLAPTDKGSKGFTWLTGFVDEKWAHYVKYSLDATFSCSTYMLDPSSWLKTTSGATVAAADGAERLTHMSDGVRFFRRFPSEEPAVCFRNFMLPVNPKLIEHVASRCVLMSVIDHEPGRRAGLLKLVAKVLRNRHKSSNPNSKTKGLNFYIPAIQGLRKERDESQRLHFVKGIQSSTVGANINIKELLSMPLNELRVKFWTFSTLHEPSHPAPPPPSK